MFTNNKCQLINFLGDELFRKHLPLIDHFIAASKEISYLLGKHYKLDLNKITVVDTFIDKIPEKPDKDIISKIKKELNIPHNSFIIIGSGTVDWRKGPDLFLQVAKKVLNNSNKFYFVWVGGNKALLEYKQLIYDIEMLNIASNVKFIGEKENPIPYFAISDVFFLSSREEPMGMVALEAAALHKPIICFENIGSMPDFVGENCGIVAPYYDIDFVVRAILSLSEDPILLKRLGENAFDKVKGYLIDIKAPLIVSLFKKLQSQ